MFTKLFSHIKPLKFGKEKPPLKTTADPVIQTITQDISSTTDAEALPSQPNTTITIAELPPARLCLSLPAEPRTREQNRSVEVTAAVLAARQRAGIHPSPAAGMATEYTSSST